MGSRVHGKLTDSTTTPKFPIFISIHFPRSTMTPTEFICAFCISAFFLVSNIAVVNGTKSVVQERVAVADIVLVIDQSKSIRAHYDEELDFAKKFVNYFPVNTNETRFALIQFSVPENTRVRLAWTDGTSKEKILSTIDSMQNDSLGLSTDFAKSLTVALHDLCRPERGDRKEVPNVLVMVTDGFLNNPWERKKASDAASELRNAGVLMYAIQVKTDPDLPVGDGPVQDLALLTGNRSRVFAVENFEKLTNELLGQITQQISVEYNDCVYEYIPNGANCYQSESGKCVMDGELKIDRLPTQPHGRPCPTLNRTQIDCQTETGCQTGSTPVNALPDDPQREVSVVEGSAGKGLPFWAIVTVAVAGALLVLLAIVAVIIARTPRWRAVFIPAKPGKPQLPGNTDDSMSTSTHSQSEV